MEFITIKIVQTEPMTSIEAMAKGYRVNEDSLQIAGYEVTYEDGYKSWCPAEVMIGNAIPNKPEYSYNNQCPAWAPDHLKRMYEEFDELRNRYINLSVFMTGNKFDELDDARKHYLRLQYKFMCGYINVLDHRIEYEYKIYKPAHEANVE